MANSITKPAYLLSMGSHPWKSAPKSIYSLPSSLSTVEAQGPSSLQSIPQQQGLGSR